MSAPYEDAPLMIATGAIGVWFGVVGIRAILAQWRSKAVTHETTAPAKGWDEGVPVRRTKPVRR